MKVRVGFGPGTTAAMGMGAETFWSILDTVEELRWDSIWFSERITGDLFDPIAAMSALAGRTKRIKFGTSVLALPERNPVLLAKQLATIDVLSGGRLIPAFGLGAEAIQFDPAERAARTEESVALMKRLWTDDNVTHEGQYFRVRGVSVHPRPIQKPHPDVWFGGHSKPALRRVARLGEGWLPSFVAAAEYRGKADVIRSLASEAGREIDNEHYGALVPYVPESVASPDVVLAAVAARRPGVDPNELIVTEGVKALRARLESFIEQGASKFVVVPALPPPDWSDELAQLREEVAVPLEN